MKTTVQKNKKWKSPMSNLDDLLPTAAVRGVLLDELVTVVIATCRQRLPCDPLCGRRRPLWTDRISSNPPHDTYL